VKKRAFLHKKQTKAKELHQGLHLDLHLGLHQDLSNFLKIKTHQKPVTVSNANGRRDDI